MSALPRLRARALILMLPGKMEEICQREILAHYLANGLQMLTESTAKIAGGGNYLAMSYADIINPKPIDDRSGEEIAAAVIAGAGLRIKQE